MEPIIGPLGLKALSWNNNIGQFVSPASHWKDAPIGLSQDKFIWGLVMKAYCENGHDPDDIPHDNCRCGLYCAYSMRIIEQYMGYSPISPIFLVEGSSNFQPYEWGYISGEMQIRAVALTEYANGIGKAAAYQAVDWYGIPLLDIESMTILMDLHNATATWDRKPLLPNYKVQSPELSRMSHQEILEVRNQIAMEVGTIAKQEIE
jgi:hypothetical protein